MWYLLSTLPPPLRAIHRWQHTHRIFQCAFLNGSVTLFLIQLSFSVSLPHWRSTGSVHAGGARVGWGNIRGKEGRGEREIGKDVLWIKEVEIWKGMLLLYERG